MAHEERERRKCAIYALIQDNRTQKAYNEWLENFALLLLDKQLESQSVAIMLAAKVCVNIVILSS
jgi:hypothetical protein